MAGEKRKVRSTDEMDAETFLKHINAGHVPIGKMDHVGKSNVPGDEDENLLRAYHAKIHDVFDDLPEGETSQYSSERVPDHTHVAPRKDS